MGDFANTAAYNPALIDALSVADHGIRLGIELTASLERAGRTEDAFTISSRLTFAVNEVRDDFQSAAETVQALNQELLILQQQWAGVLTEEQIAQGVAEFQERHKDEYKALEDAAAKLNHIFPGLAALEGRPELSGHGELEDLAERGVEQFEVYSQTQIGAETITDQVQKSGDGLPTWLDSVVSLAESVHGSAEAADNIVQLMFRAVAGQGAVLAQSQDTAGLAQVGLGLIDEFEHRAELEADSKAFLEAAGFTAEQAEHLGQYTSFNPPTTIGPFLTEYAEQLGISTAELGEQLMAADPKTLEFLVDHKETVSALGLSVSDVASWRQIDPELTANDIHTLGLAGQGLGLEGEEFTRFLEELYFQSNPTPAEFIEAAAAAQTAYHGAPPAGVSEEEYQRGLIEYVTQALREEFPDLEDLLP